MILFIGCEAMHRELEIKKKKSRKYIEWLVSYTDSYGELERPEGFREGRRFDPDTLHNKKSPERVFPIGFH